MCYITVVKFENNDKLTMIIFDLANTGNNLLYKSMKQAQNKRNIM